MQWANRHLCVVLYYMQEAIPHLVYTIAKILYTT
jgi:hypothetical protein